MKWQGSQPREREKGQITGKLKACVQIRVEGVDAPLPLEPFSPRLQGSLHEPHVRASDCGTGGLAQGPSGPDLKEVPAATCCIATCTFQLQWSH